MTFGLVTQPQTKAASASVGTHVRSVLFGPVGTEERGLCLWMCWPADWHGFLLIASCHPPPPPYLNGAGGNTIQNGWRCGSTITGDAGWERVLYHADF